MWADRRRSDPYGGATPGITGFPSSLWRSYTRYNRIPFLLVEELPSQVWVQDSLPPRGGATQLGIMGGPLLLVEELHQVWVEDSLPPCG
jgi:hypothetical protein